jgi:hypothetical protein
VTLILDYASPPPQRLNRTPFVLVAARYLATLSIIYYAGLMFWEPAFQYNLREHDVSAWFDNEVQRRMVEMDRRAGVIAAPAPPVPTPVASGKILLIGMYFARGAALLWAVVLGVGLGRCGKDLARAKPLIHFSCVSKLALVAPLMVLTVVAYARPFLEAGQRSPLVVMILEIGSIACAWTLLMQTPIDGPPQTRRRPD